MREKRKKCVETRKQVKYCKRFEKFLKHSREIFGKKDKLEVYIKKQENILFGIEQEKYGYIPKILLKVLEKIQLIKYKNNLNNETIYKFILNFELEINEEIEKVIEMMKYKINNNDWSLFDNTFNLTIVLELMFVWLEEHVEFVINLEETKKIISNELYIKYINLISSNSIKNNNEIDLIKKSLLKFIKKNYSYYEYEILHKFSLFFSEIPYSTKEEENLFLNCLEKISTGLLGKFNNKNKKINESNESRNENYFNEKEFKLLIKPVIIGLTHIMKLIYDLSITSDDNLVAPKKRKHRISIYSNKFLLNDFRKSLNNEIDNNIINKINTENIFPNLCAPNEIINENKVIENISEQMENNFCNDNNNNNENNNLDNSNIHINNNFSNDDYINTNTIRKNNVFEYEKNFAFNSKIFKSNFVNSNDNNKNTSRNNLIVDIKNEYKNSRNSMKSQNSKYLNIPKRK